MIWGFESFFLVEVVTDRIEGISAHFLGCRKRNSVHNESRVVKKLIEFKFVTLIALYHNKLIISGSIIALDLNIVNHPVKSLCLLIKKRMNFVEK